MSDGGPARERIEFRFVRPPGREHVYCADVLYADEGSIVLEQTVSPSKPLTIGGVEVLAAGYKAVWFLFRNAPYDVARFYHPNGSWMGYYVDILEPVHWSNSDPRTLDPILDLFLDLWVSPKGEYWVLDEDEFETAFECHILTASQAQHARDALAACIAGIQGGLFPPATARNFR